MPQVDGMLLQTIQARPWCVGGGGGGTRFFPHKTPVYLKCTWNNLETEYHIPKKICQGTETPSLPHSRF